MTLLITVIAAITATLVWYFNDKRKEYKLGTLALMYWGASLMWLIDAVFEYMEFGADFFLPAGADMLNDTYLGLCVAALGMIIWLVIMLVSDPKGVIKGILFEKKEINESIQKAGQVKKTVE